MSLPYITIKEAKNKWCPYSSGTGSDQCLANECMKWEAKKDFTPCVAMGDVVQEKPEPMGRCTA